ncbi:hypothetical protein V474_01890 [Novosphingobium barchaimii LL02]|uniref:Lysozyme inhibitor LprI-like N-terminal domain-containing protein n=2 Tax=Novosphingobium barchaimii TaxID=1420591 RepID=A0A0J7XL30_9SPHN|nr:hypothetical protein V474_01890 [Novosphingobium barchaimii LL02]
MLLAASILPAPLAATPSKQPATYDAGWLTWCINARGGTTLADARCYVEHREALVARQGVLLKKIEATLSIKGPDGTDYAKAARALSASQKAWEAFMSADCDLVDNVSGFYGTAVGLAGEDCLITHYLARNAALASLQQDYLDQ